MRPTFMTLMLAAALGGLLYSDARAQQPRAERQTPAATRDGMTLKVYRVSDLVMPRRNYPYRGSVLPTTGSTGVSPGGGFPMGGGLGGGGMGGMGGGLGGGGGMGGGGFFQVVDDLSGEMGMGPGGLGGQFSGDGGLTSRFQFSIDDLVNALVSTVAPESWQQAGGQAAITPLGGMLLILQTSAAHEQIQMLLDAIRSEGGGQTTVTVRAYWMLLNANAASQAEQELRSSADGAAARGVLEQLSKDVISYRGVITCFSEQTVHLVSGTRRHVVTSAIPTVGGSSVGYSPVVAIPNIGVLLEVTPYVVPGSSEAILDVESTVTGWQDTANPIRISSGSLQPSEMGGTGDPGGMPTGGGSTTSIELDRINLESHQLATTLRVPLNRPVLVGGMSDPAGTQLHKQVAGESEQLYLFVEVGTNEEPARGDSPKK